jgi:hypothetical protein
MSFDVLFHDGKIEEAACLLRTKFNVIAGREDTSDARKQREFRSLYHRVGSEYKNKFSKYNPTLLRELEGDKLFRVEGSDFRTLNAHSSPLEAEEYAMHEVLWEAMGDVQNAAYPFNTTTTAEWIVQATGSLGPLLAMLIIYLVQKRVGVPGLNLGGAKGFMAMAGAASMKASNFVLTAPIWGKIIGLGFTAGLGFGARFLYKNLHKTEYHTVPTGQCLG